METTTSCLYRVKNIMVYMNHFKATLNRLADADKSVRELIFNIYKQSEALSKLLEELAYKLNYSSATDEDDAQSNRRQSDRLKVEAEGIFIINNSAEKSYQLQDLSETGMKIIGDKPVKTGETADIIISSPFLRNTIHKNAQIVWDKQLDDNLWVAGVEFDKE